MRFFTLFLFLALALQLHAQQYTFLSYSTEQGLPQTQVTSIVEDDLGFLWVGTLGGLAKFNGKEFEPYTTENGMLNNRISSLSFIDNELWIGHEGGVSRQTANGFVKWKLDQEFQKIKVSKIVKYKNQLLFSTNGAGLYQIDDGKMSKVKVNGVETDRIRDVEIYGDRIFIATKVGVYHSNNLSKWTACESLKDISISGIKVTQSKLFVSTFQDGLYKIEGNNLVVSKVENGNLPASIKSIFISKEQQLWVNSNEGIFLFDKLNKVLKLTEQNGMPMQAIQEVYQDKNGNIWLASEGKGLIRFTGKAFVYFNKNSGLVSDLIVSISQDRNKNMWLGTYDKGLNILYKNGQKKSIEIGNNTVWSSIHDVDGYTWVGTGSGLFSLQNEKIINEYYWEEGTPGDKITALLKINSNEFLIGGNEGVSIYRHGKIKKISNEKIATVRSFCKVKQSIYCATDIGLYKIQGEKLISVGNVYKSIYGLEQDENGNLWIGTEEGLFLFDGEHTTNIFYSKNPASNYINFLNRNKNELYIGTNNGLYVLSNFNTAKEYKVLRYGIGEGIPSLETNINSSFVDANGNLWFGTAAGLVNYRATEKIEKEANPTLIMKQILINFKESDFNLFSNSKDRFGIPDQLNLPYNKNNISFNLEAISLANHPGMQFLYKLEGLEEKWHPGSQNSSISYNSLPAGNYVFHAKCIDARGKESNVITIPIKVAQAFYKSWWFVAILIFSVSAMVFYLFRLRLKREREANERERLEFKSRLLSLEQRTLNASMNRHFIFNSLNSIQYFINTQDKLSANKFLTNFAKLIRKNLDSSEEGNQVTLAQELDRLNLYLSLESMRFKDRFTYTIHCDEDVEVDEIVIPAMILQPFVENSIIHGILPNEDKKGLIEVDIRMVGDELVINLLDNGIGIEESKKSKTDYDGDHKSQGMEITSKRIELLNKFGDRKIEIIGPFQIEDQYHSINGTGVTIKIQIKNLDN